MSTPLLLIVVSFGAPPGALKGISRNAGRVAGARFRQICIKHAISGLV